MASSAGGSAIRNDAKRSPILMIGMLICLLGNKVATGSHHTVILLEVGCFSEDTIQVRGAVGYRLLKLMAGKVT